MTVQSRSTESDINTVLANVDRIAAEQQLSDDQTTAWRALAATQAIADHQLVEVVRRCARRLVAVSNENRRLVNQLEQLIGPGVRICEMCPNELTGKQERFCGQTCGKRSRRRARVRDGPRSA